jgi:hypothetical protein
MPHEAPIETAEGVNWLGAEGEWLTQEFAA